ncbi:hypothetical protein M0R45_002821 [Rubus argutus]|uniref:Uncharacterized protein n=1 Tax=Rubus argutus TaxID=59490 RepID=A0AAW1VS97_RUBAR
MERRKSSHHHHAAAEKPRTKTSRDPLCTPPSAAAVIDAVVDPQNTQTPASFEVLSAASHRFTLCSNGKEDKKRMN